jgi:putative FmdB family regulatory protein
MPLYDFQCPSGHRTERVMSMSSITPNITIDCEVCGMESHRAFTPTGNIVRPDGWNLKPEDAGYYDIPIERHPHIRDHRRGI